MAVCTRREMLQAFGLVTGTLLTGCQTYSQGKTTPDSLITPLPRADWTHIGPNLAGMIPMGGVKIITVLEDEPDGFTETDFSKTATRLEKLRNLHRSQNFADIRAHYALDPAGRLWTLRDERFQGEWVKYNNEHNLTLCLLGNYDSQPLSTAQKEILPRFLHQLRIKHFLAINRIFTKHEIISVDNPGINVQRFMVAIRNNRAV